MLEEVLGEVVATGETVVRRGSADEATVGLLHEGKVAIALRLTRESTRAQWAVMDLALRAVRADSGLTSKGVRALPLGEFIHHARKALARSAEADGRGGEGEGGGGLRMLSDSQLSGFRDRKARDRTDRDFAELAFEYVMKVQEGDRTPAVSLASTFGGTPNTWSNRLLEARKRGLLTRSVRGEAGGTLTTKAEDILFPDAEELSEDE